MYFSKPGAAALNNPTSLEISSVKSTEDAAALCMDSIPKEPAYRMRSVLEEVEKLELLSGITGSYVVRKPSKKALKPTPKKKTSRSSVQFIVEVERANC